MTKAQLEFLNRLKHLAAKCNCNISEYDIEAYFDVMEPIGWDLAIEAIKMSLKYLRGNGQMPSPNDLLGYVGKSAPEPMKKRDEGMEIAAMIINAISKFGYLQPLEARAAIGEDAWRVVLAMGGWSQICEIQTSQLETFRAQVRDMAEVSQKRTHIESNVQNSISGKIGDTIQNLSSGMDLQSRINSKRQLSGLKAAIKKSNAEDENGDLH